jgi:predicted nucleic acid-binding protein
MPTPLLYAHTALDFVDCLLAQQARRDHEPIVSFDRDFDTIADVTRQEPETF